MKTILTLVLIICTLATLGQVQPIADVAGGLTSRARGRLNVDAGVAIAHASLEANFMAGEYTLYAVTAGLDFGERPFAVRIYAGPVYGTFYQVKYDAAGFIDEIPCKAIRPLGGIKWLWGCGAIDLRFTSRDFALTIGFSITELLKPHQ